MPEYFLTPPEEEITCHHPIEVTRYLNEVEDELTQKYRKGPRSLIEGLSDCFRLVNAHIDQSFFNLNTIPQLEGKLRESEEKEWQTWSLARDRYDNGDPRGMAECIRKFALDKLASISEPDQQDKDLSDFYKLGVQISIKQAKDSNLEGFIQDEDLARALIFLANSI